MYLKKGIYASPVDSNSDADNIIVFKIYVIITR